MKFKELLYSFTLDEIKKRVVELYPKEYKNLHGYEHVYMILKDLIPLETQTKIYLEEAFDTYDKTLKYIRVLGKESPSEEVPDGLWALGFTEWNEWLGMEIEGTTLGMFPKLDIVCHSLWEMTFYSWSDKGIVNERIKFLENHNELKGDENEI